MLCRASCGPGTLPPRNGESAGPGPGTEVPVPQHQLPDPNEEVPRNLPGRAPAGTASGRSQRRAIALCRRLIAVHYLSRVDKNPGGGVGEGSLPLKYRGGGLRRET